MCLFSLWLYFSLNLLCTVNRDFYTEQPLTWIRGLLYLVVMPWDLLGVGLASLLVVLTEQTNTYECRRTAAAPQAFSQQFTYHSRSHKGQNKLPEINWESSLDHCLVRDLELGTWALLRGADMGPLSLCNWRQQQ